MIRVSHLTKRYGGFTAVDDLSFEVAPGETFALLGPNGSGKSTTLKCLVGLAEPDAGGIEIAGCDLRRDPRRARRQISYLPQRADFHDVLTAREVLDFYRRLRHLPPERVAWALDPARFHFNGFADKPVGQFSGGMKQRLALAVACLPDAPVLLLDEPTASLDPASAVRFRRFLAALKSEGKTIVFTSHVLADVEQLADRVAILVGGRLAVLESIADLREKMKQHSLEDIYLRYAQGETGQ